MTLSTVAVRDGEDSSLEEELRQLLRDLTVEVTDLMHREVALASYGPIGAGKLRKKVVRVLIGRHLGGIELFDEDTAENLASRMVATAEKRRGRR